jgi:hypothetical protein
VGRFRIGLDATHAGIRSSLPSTMGSPMTSLAQGTLPYHSPLESRKSAASADGLSPGPLSAPRHSTSELLRTLSRMAASKPTSWLSGRQDILSH